jgi:hypothetical protein
MDIIRVSEIDERQRLSRFSTGGSSNVTGNRSLLAASRREMRDTEDMDPKTRGGD